MIINQYYINTIDFCGFNFLTKYYSNNIVFKNSSLRITYLEYLSFERI